MNPSNQAFGKWLVEYGFDGQKLGLLGGSSCIRTKTALEQSI